MEKAAYDNGLSKPLAADEGSPAAIAAGFDQNVIEDVLIYAMETGHAPAATAAVRILGTKGKAETLLCQGAQPAPLVRALRHPDRRLRFVALETILQLKPAKPFAGSSYVTDALGYFIATRGTRRALVADLRREDARKLAGLFIRLGYQVDTAISGPEVIRQAIASPDYEVILVAASLGQRPIQIMLQQLRFDSRSLGARGVFGRDGQAGWPTVFRAVCTRWISFVIPKKRAGWSSTVAQLGRSTSPMKNARPRPSPRSVGAGER